MPDPDATGPWTPAASLQELVLKDAASDLGAALRQVVDAAQSLFQVTGAGLMFVDEQHSLRYVVSSDRHGRVLEEVQERVGRGPCVDALILDEVVDTVDVTADDRWPELAPVLVETDVRAVLGVPVHLAGSAIGSLDAYHDEPYTWKAGQAEALRAYSDVIESLLTASLAAARKERVVQQLQHALDNRVVIERAIGLVMGREGVDAVTAFNRIRRVARNGGRRVAAVAEEILDGTPLPPADS